MQNIRDYQGDLMTVENLYYFGVLVHPVPLEDLAGKKDYDYVICETLWKVNGGSANYLATVKQIKNARRFSPPYSLHNNPQGISARPHHFIVDNQPHSMNIAP